jgi:hypothetical protein
MSIPATARENTLLERDHLLDVARSTEQNFERATKDAVQGVGEKVAEAVVRTRPARNPTKPRQTVSGAVVSPKALVARWHGVAA